MTASRYLNATHYFDLATALQLASAAELVYADPHKVERTVIEGWRYSHFCFLDVEATQCLVAADAESILVCFRGTEADRPEDWIADLDFDLVDGPLGGCVHEGFYDALSCVWHLLDKEVGRLQDDSRRSLWVTGHSLGAALAALAVARWCEAGRPVSGLYTFGQPRTGDCTFTRNFDFDFRPHAFRIVNNLDVVTRTPPRSLGYEHHGTFIYFTDSGALSDDVRWWQRFLDGWQGAVDMILDWGREGIQDHGIGAYRQQIETALRNPTKPRAADDVEASRPPRAEPAAAVIRPRRRAA